MELYIRFSINKNARFLALNSSGCDVKLNQAQNDRYRCLPELHEVRVEQETPCSMSV